MSLSCNENGVDSDMMKAIVIDDEWYNLEEISELVEKTGYFRVVGKYQNPLVALKEAPITKPQVAFIDIELPELDGITFAEKLLEIDSTIIIVFITSYNQYAVQAFDVNAMDYILKPIKIERFSRMIEKVRDEIRNRSQNAPSTIKVQVFGTFHVTIGDIVVKWQRTKAKELFAYLLMHRDTYIHKEKIIENLWSDHEPEKALQILQTSVCKIRNIFSQMKHAMRLDYSNNRYCLTIEGAECDYFQVSEALANYTRAEQGTYEAVIEAAMMYANGFFVEEGYLWSIEIDQQLRNDLLNALKEILNTVKPKKNQDTTIAVLKAISKLSPEDEESNYSLITLYQETGNIVSASNHYQWLEKTLREQYDAVPSARIKDILQKQ